MQSRMQVNLEMYIKVYFLVAFVLTDAHHLEDEEGEKYGLYLLFITAPMNCFIPIDIKSRITDSYRKCPVIRLITMLFTRDV